MKPSKITMEEWMQEVTFICNNVRPKNSFTKIEFQKKRNISRSMADTLLQKLVASGKVKKTKTLENGKWSNLYIVNDKRLL